MRIKEFKVDIVKDEPLPIMDDFLVEHTQREVLPHPDYSITEQKIADGAVSVNKLNVNQLSAISADLGDITAGTITLDSTGFIKGGQTAYNTGTGFWLGYDTDAYKFSLGDPDGDYQTFDGSNITLWATIKAKNMKHYYISDDVYVEETTTDSHTNTSYVKRKTITLGSDWGKITLRVYFTLRSGNSSETVYGRIYKNGVAYGTVRSTNSTTNVSWSEDLEFSPGDDIQLYTRTSSGSYSVINDNFAIHGTTTPQKFTTTVSVP